MHFLEHSRTPKVLRGPDFVVLEESGCNGTIVMEDGHRNIDKPIFSHTYMCSIARTKYDEIILLL